MESNSVNFAFCIGNGVSRLKFDLTKIDSAGPTYGCNQLVETFNLDNTIVVDRELLIDLIARGYGQKTNLYTRSKWKNLVQAPNLFFLDPPIQTPQTKWDNEIHWGSGTHALNLAAKNKAQVIIMLGYDLYQKNIYNGTVVDPQCWIYQIKKCFEMYPETQFVQIQNDDWTCPEEWDADNFSVDSFKNLYRLIS